MDFWKFFFLAAACVILTSDAQTIPPTPCPGTVPIGDDIATFSSNLLGHGDRQTVVLFDPSYTIQCCGVVVKWELKVYDSIFDGCSSTCKVDFMVFDTLDTSSKKARLAGVNMDYTVAPNATGKFTTVDIPVDQQLPVKPGDVVGFSGDLNAVDYFEETNDCSAQNFRCHQNYMATTRGTKISSTNVNQVYNFQVLGTDTSNSYRYYALRAKVEKGAAPKFTSLPSYREVQSTATIGTRVWTVLFSDDNTLDTLRIKLVRQCPIGNYFNLSSTTGNTSDIIVSSSLAQEPYLIHTLTLEVTDGCQTTTQTIDIRVIGPATTTAATTPTTAPAQTTSSNTNNNNTNNGNNNGNSGGLLKTRDGKILVGLLAGALALALATLIGLCCLCCLIKSLMGKINKTQPVGYGDPYYNPYSNPEYSQPQGQYHQPQGDQGGQGPQTQLRANTNSLNTDYPNEPRPPSFHPSYSSNKVDPKDPTPRDINLRTVTPNKYYKNQLFW